MPKVIYYITDHHIFSVLCKEYATCFANSLMISYNISVFTVQWNLVLYRTFQFKQFTVFTTISKEFLFACTVKLRQSRLVTGRGHLD